MNMVRIMTDSTCDLSPERQKALGVEVVPLSVHFGAESFRDGVDLSNAEFYERLRGAETLPTTAQVNPEEFISRFQDHVGAGDQVVGIFLASQLSGTCQSALIARGIVDEANIFVVDSTTVTFGLGLLVEMAAQLRDAGLSAPEIAAQVEQLAGRLRFYAVVGTLKYLKMGGRISGTAAVVGGMLGITRRTPPCLCPSATPTARSSWPSARTISGSVSPAWRSWRATSAPWSVPMPAPAARASRIL